MMFLKKRISSGLKGTVLLFLILCLPIGVYASAIKKVDLTDEEKAFVQTHETIRIGYDPNFIPYEFQDKDGAFKGICADYVTLLNKKLGLNMQPVEVKTWEEVISKAKDKEIDVLPGIGVTESRKPYFIFTRPYIQFQRAIYTRNDFSGSTSLSELSKHKVGVQKDSSHHGFLESLGLENLMLYDTAEEALLAVASDKVELYVGNLTTTNYIVKNMGIGNVRVASTIENENGLAFAIRDDWPVLKSILEKGLDAVTEAEKIEIINKWSGVEVKADFQPVYRVIFQITAIILLVIAVTLHWMGKLRQENKARLKAQENLNEALKQLENLYNASLVLSSTLKLEDVLEKIIAKLRETIPFDYATIQVKEDEVYEIIYTSGFDADVDLIGEAFALKDYPLMSETLLQKKPYVVSENSLRVNPYGLDVVNIQSRLLLPLVFGDEVIGILTLDHKSKHHFTDDMVKWGMAYAIHAAIALYNAELFEAVKSAKEDAEEATRVKGEFLANMSHEIRTPLNAIIGLTNLALKTELNDKQREYLSKVDVSSRNLLEIINDILDFSKIEAGMLQLESVSFDLNTVVIDLSNIMAFHAKQKRLDFIIDVDENLPQTLIGDPLRLEQVLLNLTSNAIKFTDKGQVVVKITMLNENEEEDKVALGFEVKDTGIGLTKDQERMLFRSFEQADASTTRRFGGTGLGLAISQNLVKLLGGQINVTSEYGVGSSFYFSLVFKTVNEIVPSKFNGLQGSQNRFKVHQTHKIHRIIGAKILLVEDNDINQIVTKELLRDEGLKVICASNGLEAVDITSEDETIDLILMDLQMPKMDGYEATNMIRQFAEPMRGVPIVAMTADAMEGTKEKVLRSGFDDYVAKPVVPSELFEVLSKHISDIEKAYSHSNSKVEIQPNLSSQLFDRDLKSIDTQDGLMRVTGNKELYLRLLTMFYHNNKNLEADLRGHIGRNDFDKASQLLHSLKGVAGNLGAKTLKNAAVELESAIIERLIIKEDKTLRDFKMALENVLNDIKPIAGNGKEKSNYIHRDHEKDGDLTELHGHIEELLPSVIIGDVKMCKEKVRCLENKSWPTHYQEDINALIHAISKYKYEMAESIATELIEKLSS